MASSRSDTIMKVKGGVPIRRIPRTPTVSILPVERVFHKLPDGTYEPATITLEAVVQNVDNPKYQWGHIVGGSFQPYSVVYSHMIASPVHAGVVAVKVTGDNVPNAIIASETLTIVEDGVSPVQYEIDIKQLNRKVEVISCDNRGNPKIYYRATAYLFRITGNKREPCSNFYCTVLYYKNGVVSKSEGSSEHVDNYTFAVDGDYDDILVGFTDSSNVAKERSISKVYDGSTGNPGSNGYTYRSRGMFTIGETYIWDDMYRDVVFAWFNNKLYTFRVKEKGTSVIDRPTSSNGDVNWDVANDMRFTATDLLLAQDAIVNVLGTSKIFIGELDKTEGWEMTKGAIKHTGTGLELTKDGKLSTPEGGITIGTKSVEGMIDDVHIGGRNYARRTSNEWSDSIALTNIVNQTFPLYDCYLTDVKAGDVVCFSFSLEYSNIVKNSNPIFQLQAPGSDTGWDNGGMGANILPFVQAGSGTVRVVAFYTVTEYQLNNKYWPVGIRCDNIAGSVRYKNFKFEIGTKPTDWSLAPEDYVDTGIDIQNRKIILQADTTEFRNNAGELIAIFQGDKIKASLIDVDNLVAKKVETSNSGKRFVIDPDSNSMEVFDANNNKVISISFKDINDPNVDLLYPSIVCYQYIDGIARNSASINGNNVQVLSYDTNGNAVYNATFSASGYYVSNGNSGNHSILSYDGLRIYKNGTLYKSYT
ncbi:hypothetical protein INE81_01358 [Bacteroides salyersiae]|uniref:hypothetical protein n=1 Tax=Bacteroides salyersiae TaxID=291644 RepID=UPI001B8BFE36|nr:hypothetical protein [Bacteroides salyersiae]QUT74915.1 hypothetical protein INE81_01358 [Bacteroides salyersiae]